MGEGGRRLAGLGIEALGAELLQHAGDPLLARDREQLQTNSRGASASPERRLGRV